MRKRYAESIYLLLLSGLPEKDYVKMLSGNSMFLSMSAKIKAEMEEAKKENDLYFSDEKLITWKSENRRIDKKS